MTISSFAGAGSPAAALSPEDRLPNQSKQSIQAG